MEKIKRSFRLDKSNYDFLSRYKDKMKVKSIDRILNDILSYIVDGDDKEINFNRIDDSPIEKETHIIRIKLTDSEVNLLKKEAEYHGFKSVAKEVRFRLLNSMYQENFFNNIEMKDLTFAVNSLNKVGRNLSALLAAIRNRDQNVNINFSNFEKMIKMLDGKIYSITSLLQKYFKVLKTRI